MPNTKLGRRQRRMLTDMARFGQGRWPAHWKQRAEDKKTLTALHRRGLVTDPGYQAALTERGQAAAAEIRAFTGRWHRVPCRCVLDTPTGMVLDYRCGIAS